MPDMKKELDEIYFESLLEKIKKNAKFRSSISVFAERHRLSNEHIQALRDRGLTVIHEMGKKTLFYHAQEHWEISW